MSGPVPGMVSGHFKKGKIEELSIMLSKSQKKKCYQSKINAV